MKIGNAEVTPSQLLAIILLAAPPVVTVILDVGPGRWFNAAQGRLLGVYSPSLSALGVIFMEFLFIGIAGVTVRRLTGRTIVQLFTREEHTK